MQQTAVRDSTTTIPFTGIEELLLILDSPAEPQNQRCEFEVPGVVDADRMRGAARDAAARHPIARARLRRWRPSDRHLVWEVREDFDADPIVAVSAQDEDAVRDAREEIIGRPFDLFAAPPWRLGVITHTDRTHLVLAVHHAAMDGQGIVLWCRELAAAYAGREPETPVRLAPPLPEGGKPSRLNALVGPAQGLLQRTERVASEGHTPGAPGVHLDGVMLDAAATKGLNPKAHDVQAGMQDLLVAGGIVAIDRWNREHGAPRGRIALLNAVGLPAPDGASPLTNAWMGNVVSVGAKQRSSPVAVLEAVAAQRREQTARASAAGMREALGNGLPVPVWAKRAAGAIHPLTGQRLVETAALSGMGRVAPLDLGDGLLSDRVWIDSAVRLPKGLFICPALHDGELHVGLRSMRAQLGRAALRRIGETYLAALTELGTAA